MDFLNPRKSRSRQIKLALGYLLMGVVAAVGTVLLVYNAYGFGIDRSGNLVENGLLFVDSRQTGANISLSDTKTTRTDKTDTRMVVPNGQYSLTLSKDGYKSWTKDFYLQEHTVKRIIYPILFPSDFTASSLKTYSSAPSFITQSPDKKWVLVQQPATPISKLIFNVFDTSKITAAQTDLTLPDGLLSADTAITPSLELVAWASDNSRLLVKHTFGTTQEYLIIDRQNAAHSVNLNKQFSLSLSGVDLYNGNLDQVYLLDSDGNLNFGNVADKTISKVLAKNVVAYSSSAGSDQIFFATKGSQAGKLDLFAASKDKSYQLGSVQDSGTLLLANGSYQGRWYLAVGNSQDERINIYRDPLAQVRDQANKTALPAFALRNKGTDRILFSDKNRFISAQAGNSFAVYDLDEDVTYKYVTDEKIDGNMTWLDAFHMSGLTNGQTIVMEFDGQNRTLLGSSLLPAGIFIDDNPNIALSLTTSSKGFNLNYHYLKTATDR